MKHSIEYRDTPLYLALKDAKVSEDLATSAAICFVNFSNDIATKTDMIRLETDIADLRADTQKTINTLIMWIVGVHLATFLGLAGLIVGLFTLL